MIDFCYKKGFDYFITDHALILKIIVNKPLAPKTNQNFINTSDIVVTINALSFGDIGNTIAVASILDAT